MHYFPLTHCQLNCHNAHAQFQESIQTHSTLKTGVQQATIATQPIITQLAHSWISAWTYGPYIAEGSHEWVSFSPVLQIPIMVCVPLACSAWPCSCGVMSAPFLHISVLYWCSFRSPLPCSPWWLAHMLPCHCRAMFVIFFHIYLIYWHAYK